MPEPLASPRDTVFVGARTTRGLAALLVLVGVVAAVVGVGLAVNGATVAPARVEVPVSLAAADDEAGGPSGEAVAVDLPDVPLPAGVQVQTAPDAVRLASSAGTDRLTGFLARGDGAVAGLAVLAGAMLLAPVLRSVADGVPFRRGNARRIGLVGLLVVVAGVVAPVLPQVAAMRVLDGLDLVGPGSPFVAGLGLSLAPLGLAALVLVVAEAFRRGTQLADDARGLV